MLIDRINTGDRVEITITTDQKEKHVFKSVVEAVVDKNRVVVQAPIVNGRLIKIPKDQVFSILFLSDSGMYRFDAQAMGYAMVDGFAVVNLKLLSKGERVQRRNFFRYNCHMPISFAIIKEDGEQSEDGLQRGIAIDIGGGGMRIVSAYNAEEQQMLRATLALDDERLMVFGKILHKQLNPGTVKLYQYRIMFTAMTNSDQEKIVRFIYKEQRKRLKQ